MLCKTCGYRLWNLPSRRCPECGTPFRPSEFEFAANSVRFQCPHCSQPYYGTGEKGHLVPAEFDCVSCGRHIHMDDMVLLPAEGVAEEQTQVGRMPWLDRRERGLVRAWFATIGMALFSPARLMRATPRHAPALDAWWFAVSTSTIIMLISLCPFFLLPVLLQSGAARNSAFSARIVLTMLIFFLGLMIVITLWGCAAHGLLRLTGRTALPLRRTFHAIGYSAGANAFAGIPCIGFYVGAIWWIVSATIMLKESQRVSALRAAFAAITPPVASFVLFVAGYAWLLMYVTAIPARSTAMMPVVIAPAETRTILAGLQVHAGENNGRYPNHAIELVASKSSAVTAHSFVATGSATTVAQIPVGGTTLEKYSFLPPGRRTAVEQAAADALPQGTVAHRLGDFVFTHHGIGQEPRFTGLWLVILWPDPEANAGRTDAKDVVIGTTDGKILAYPREQFAAQLGRQNQQRQAAGLAPLPDPASVTHARPAVASQPESGPATEPSAPAEQE